MYIISHHGGWLVISGATGGCVSEMSPLLLRLMEAIEWADNPWELSTVGASQIGHSLDKPILVL